MIEEEDAGAGGQGSRVGRQGAERESARSEGQNVRTSEGRRSGDRRSKSEDGRILTEDNKGKGGREPERRSDRGVLQKTTKGTKGERRQDCRSDGRSEVGGRRSEV